MSLFKTSIPLKATRTDERRGLLTEDVVHADEDDYAKGEDFIPARQPWSSRRLAAVAICMIALILGGTFARSLLIGYHKGGWTSNRHPTTGLLRSNGTHNFKNTVLMVSIDGLRADYLDRGFTPHLLDISKKGLRAKHMQPIFPTLTFPNHWALLTGLYAESHGIVANNFWDPESQSEFHYSSRESSWNSSWWLGEPIWETAKKQGVRTANYMWPGPPETSTGAAPDYFVPWADKIPLKTKLDQICKWIDEPIETRPQLILAYEPSLDQAGHRTGPMSELVNKTLQEVDVFAKDLHTEIVARNLTDIVDIIFVSDHGMTDTSHLETVYIDDYIGAKGLAEVEHQDGWPSMGLRFSPKANATHYLMLLEEAAQASGDKFHVYTHETMPERFHFSGNPRIAPIYIVPHLGYALRMRNETTWTSKGDHGFDNTLKEMRAMFIAHGPFSQNTKYKVGGSGVIEGFENIEIYNLLVKLLGMDSTRAAPTNGTAKFWDRYVL